MGARPFASGCVLREGHGDIWLVSFMQDDLQSADSGARTTGKSVRPKSVTHVLGTFCRLFVRTGQLKIWRRGWDSNPRMEVLQTSPLGHLGTAPDFLV